MPAIWMLLVLIPGHLVVGEYASETACRDHLEAVKAQTSVPVIAAQCMKKPGGGIAA